MAQGKPKDHYVPQFYLDAFAIEGPGEKGPHIYQYMDGQVVSPRISDVASEKDYYTFVVEEEGRDTVTRAVDDFFKNIERPAASVIQRIIKEESLDITKEERERVAVFFATLAVRTPGFLNLAQALHSTAMKEIGMAGAENKEVLAEDVRKAGMEIDEKQLDELHDFVMKGEYDITFSKESKAYFVAKGLEDAKRLSGMYYAKSWHLLLVDGKIPLLTSDNPVSIYRPKYIPAVYNAGYGSGVIVIPLSPRVAILMRDKPIRKEILHINEYMVNRLNRNTIRFSNEFVFGNVHTDQFEKLFNKTQRKAYQEVKAVKVGWAPYTLMSTGVAPQEFIR